MTLASWIALSVAGLVLLGEWLHARRGARVARLAFGPKSRGRSWTKAAPALRLAAATLLAWGLVTLCLIPPHAARPQSVPANGFRHLVIALDVSPSMQLKDAGADHQATRAHRAGEVVMSILERVALEQLRVSVVAFYNTAKPVVVDTFDIAVAKNILEELPLEMAFDVGQTSLLAGIKESAALAEPWLPGSTTLLVVSDGDSLPDSGLPVLPRSIAQVLVLGVGNARTGQNIDGHMSRQDASTLRQLAARLRGVYQDVNEKHLPSESLAALASAVPMRDATAAGQREWALAAIGLGASLLAALPLVLALAGTSWKAGVRVPAPSEAARRASIPVPQFH